MCILALSAVLSIAKATTNGSANSAEIIATNSPASNVQVLNYNPGQPIYIKYTINAGKTATIEIMSDGPDGSAPPTLVGSYIWTSVVGTGMKTISLSTPGVYEADVNGARVTPIAVASIFVLPESVIGALAAIGAGLAAFGIFQYKHKKS